jgi:hypothetical protein
VPTLKLTGGKSPARSKPAAPARKSPARKPAAKQAPTRTSKPAPKRTAAAAPAQESNGNGRSPRLPEGWTKAEFNAVIKDMRKAKAAREAAAERLKESQAAANGLALELLDQGVQMSVISTELELSRQWMYTMLKERAEKEGIPAPTRSRKPAAKSTRTTKPTAKKRPATKQAASKPAAKRSPARKRPPAAKTAPTVTGRGRVRLSR